MNLFRTSFIRRAFAAATACVCASLAACASYPGDISPGMSRQQVVDRFGTPTVVHPQGQGEVLIYSTGPMGQRAYAAGLDAQGRVVRVDQILTLDNFSNIRVGEWTEKDVLNAFGRPADSAKTRGYPTVWDYRYKESEVWNSIMSVMFDADGVVQKYENGPDPRYEHGGDLRSH